jgi:hypothetical protein
MRQRFKYDKDLDCLVEIRPQANYFEEETPKGPTLIPDTLPGGVNGTQSPLDRKHYDSKSAYYGHVRDRGLAIDEPGMVHAKPVTPFREYERAAADAHYGRFNREPHERAAYMERNRK